MAGVLAKKSAAKGNLAAAYFCRDKDDTRNNPRYLLGTIACQLCKCNAQYSNFVGGEGGIRKLLGNSEIGIQGLFTKLLEEPLTKCSIPCERKLIVIDGLDETKYESREDFLDIIKRRFPMLPEWLVFFITSRPVDAVQFRFKNYNPCIKICAGNSENLEFYRQHEQDIKLFLEKSVDFSRFPYSADDVVEKCKGMFLCAFHIVKDLNAAALSGEIIQLDDVVQGDIQDYLLENVSRVFQKVGENLYKKLFGCAIVAPSSLPSAFVAFILQRENSNLKEWKVIDALSTFFESNNFDKSFDFRHNLIPELLTEKESSRELFIDRDEAGEYFRDVVVEILSAAIEHQQWEKPSVMKVLLDYFVGVGVRFLCGYQDRDSLNVVFNCLTCYQFLRKRIKRKGSEIYAVIADLKLSVGCHGLSEGQKEDLQEICLALESNIHVVLECQHLLHSCFSNTSQPVQRKLNIPAAVSNISMECTRLHCLSCTIPNGVHCFALSPDKKFLAAGGRDSPIYLLDACTLEKVQELVVVEETRHLEFRPDSKFLFFGWLRKMFSLQQGCVIELPQFANNNHCYDWGSFSFDSQYVVVGSRYLSESLCRFCSVEIFCLWAAKEIQRMDSSEVVSLCNLLEGEGLRHDFESMRQLGVEVFLFKKVQPLKDSLCKECLSFKRRCRKRFVSVRQRVIDLYADIFPIQVWNVNTGKPLLEEAFSGDVQLNPFFYLCHLTWVSNLEMRENLHGWNQRFSLSAIASLNAFFLLEEWKGRWHDLREPSVSVQGEFFCPLSWEPYLIMHAPKFQNSPFIKKSKITLDRKWIAVKPDLIKKKCNLFERVSDCEDFNFRNPTYVVVEVNQFAFTDDSRIFLYITTNKSLEALILKTGSILSSVSGLIPLHLEPGNQAGFFFRANQMERIILIKDFPTSLLRFLLFSCEAKQIEMAFFSFDNQVFLENTSVLLKQTKTADSDTVSCQSSPVNHATKYLFCSSALGEKLMARERGGEILLFFGDKATPVVVRAADHECRVTFLTFSVDGASLLFCTQMADSSPCFFVWNVHKEVLMASFDSPLGFQPVHCWCFSRDEKKLIICGAFQISIFEYDKQPLCSLLTLEPPGPFREFDKFTHCTVSSDNEALACCIADRILVHALNTPKEPSLMELPRGHFGRIEFCQFLKGRRYLISYGVDCTVLLWDLSEWKAAAFTRIAQGRESILGMAVCPSEDRVVCLTAFGRFIVIDLCGLVNDKPKEFPTSVSASKEMTSVRSFGRFDRQKDPMTLKNSGQSSNDSKPINWTEYYEEMNAIADENTESEDDLNEDHLYDD